MAAVGSISPMDPKPGSPPGDPCDGLLAPMSSRRLFIQEVGGVATSHT